MTKLRYPFGGAAIKQPCASCTGAAYECNPQPLERLPVLGGRCACNYEQDTPAAALAGNKLGADYRLYDKSGGRIAPGGQYRRRMGSCADVGADAKASARRTENHKRWKRGSNCSSIATRPSEWRQNGRPDYLAKRKGTCTNRICWRRSANAHRQQVHSLLYMAAYRLMLSKGVAV